MFAAILRASWLAQEGRIESRIAWRGNYTPGGCETSKNVALTGDDTLAKLNCVSFTTAHNILRHCMTSCGNPSLCEAREHVVWLRWRTDALTLKFFAASCCSSAFRLSKIEVNGRNQHGNREKARRNDRRDRTISGPLRHFFLQLFYIRLRPGTMIAM